MDNRDRTTHHRPLTIQPDRALTEPRVEEPGRPATSPRPQPAPTKAADQTTTLETDRWIKAEASRSRQLRGAALIANLELCRARSAEPAPSMGEVMARLDKAKILPLRC